jgi:hypothetical protein
MTQEHEDPQPNEAEPGAEVGPNKVTEEPQANQGEEAEPNQQPEEPETHHEVEEGDDG